MGAHTLIGNDVYNHKGEEIGAIKEIMLDMRSGRISYDVLSFGVFFGIGEKLFATPWTALTIDISNKRFVLNVEKDRLVNAPGFDKNQWPDMADHNPSLKQCIPTPGLYRIRTPTLYESFREISPFCFSLTVECNRWCDRPSNISVACNIAGIGGIRAHHYGLQCNVLLPGDYLLTAQLLRLWR